MLSTRRCATIIAVMGAWFMCGVTDRCVTQTSAKPPVLGQLESSSLESSSIDIPLPAGIDNDISWPPMPKLRVLPTGPVVGGAVSEGFQLLVQPQKYQVEVMEPIVLNITVKNTTNTELGFSQVGHPVRDFTADVKDDRSQSMPLTRYGNEEIKFGPLYVLTEVKLKGGGEKRYEFLVNHVVDMTMSGSYSIAIVSYLHKQGKDVLLKSNTIQIDVFPRGRLPKPAMSKAK